MKNGYVYVYLSNESNEPVYFDNFSVSHERGRLLAEDHYYSYGLKIASISSKSISSSLNTKMPHYGYQGVFSEEVSEFELNYNEFALRTYDPQIGRWTTPDPYDEFASPYLGMGNDPVNNVDPDGGSIFGAIWSFLGGGVSSSTASALTQVSCAGGASVTAAASTFVTAIRITTVSLAIGGSAHFHFASQAADGIRSGQQGFISNQSNSSILPTRKIGGTAKNGSGGGDDWEKNKISECSLDLGDWDKLTDNELFEKFKATLDYFCDGDLQNTANDIFEHFKSNTGTDFINGVLNDNIKATEQYEKLKENVRTNLEAQLIKYKGDISKLNIQIPSGPNFNAGAVNLVYNERMLGLKTLVGGTQGVDIHLENFNDDKANRRYSGVFEITIYDDFGVSCSDVINALNTCSSNIIKKVYNSVFGNPCTGIKAMWILQHLRGYKPFRTKMKFKYEFKLSY